MIIFANSQFSFLVPVFSGKALFLKKQTKTVAVSFANVRYIFQLIGCPVPLASTPAYQAFFPDFTY